MSEHIIAIFDDLSLKYRVPLQEVRPTKDEVLNSTGPAAWSDVVSEHPQGIDPELTDTRNLSYMAEPTLYDDILVLPIEFFGMGQPHSGSTNDGPIPGVSLMQYLFGASRREKSD